MTAGVESLAESETSAESGRVGYTRQGSTVHDGQWELAAHDGSSSVVRGLDRICLALVMLQIYCGA